MNAGCPAPMRRTALLVSSRKSIVGEELSASVAEQLETSRKRERLVGVQYLLRGLLVCQKCGYGFTGHYHRGQWRYYRCSGTDCRRFHGAFGLRQSPVSGAPDQDGDNADQKRREDGDPDRLEHGFDPCCSRRPRLQAALPDSRGDGRLAEGHRFHGDGPPLVRYGTRAIRKHPAVRRSRGSVRPWSRTDETARRAALGPCRGRRSGHPRARTVLPPPGRSLLSLRPANGSPARYSTPLGTSHGRARGRRNADQGERKQHDG
jgi:hypothetical protein